jgi:hypothetical protein
MAGIINDRFKKSDAKLRSKLKTLPQNIGYTYAYLNTEFVSWMKFRLFMEVNLNSEVI